MSAKEGIHPVWPHPLGTQEDAYMKAPVHFRTVAIGGNEFGETENLKREAVIVPHGTVRR